VFELIRHRRGGALAALCAFDLLEVDGEDLRQPPIELRKAGLTQLLRKPHSGIELDEHYVGLAISSIRRPAGSAERASCRSGLARLTAPRDRNTGSRSRIQRHRRCGRRRGRVAQEPGPICDNLLRLLQAGFGVDRLRPISAEMDLSDTPASDRAGKVKLKCR
jgi:hypothetical protein